MANATAYCVGDNCFFSAAGRPPYAFFGASALLAGAVVVLQTGVLAFHVRGSGAARPQVLATFVLLYISAVLRGVWFSLRASDRDGVPEHFVNRFSVLLFFSGFSMYLQTWVRFVGATSGRLGGGGRASEVLQGGAVEPRAQRGELGGGFFAELRVGVRRLQAVQELGLHCAVCRVLFAFRGIFVFWFAHVRQAARSGPPEREDSADRSESAGGAVRLLRLLWRAQRVLAVGADQRKVFARRDVSVHALYGDGVGALGRALWGYGAGRARATEFARRDFVLIVVESWPYQQALVEQEQERC